MVTYSDTGMLYSGEDEWTTLRASTRSQNYNTEKNPQTTKEYIRQDATYIKFKILQTHSVVYVSGSSMVHP